MSEKRPDATATTTDGPMVQREIDWPFVPLNEQTSHVQYRNSTPHRCPVCEGRTVVPAGFYAPGGGLLNTAPEPCRTCKGAGIVWG